MGKPLSEMALEELWRLFPIYLTEPDARWGQWFADERERLCAVLPPGFCISHIGSTAIRNIWAKPIIDILVEIPEEAVMEEVRRVLESNGYLCMSRAEGRLSFNRGYTEDGFAERVFHLHLRRAGDNDELYFRDCMNDNPALAKQYEALKLSLWKEYEFNRDAYTEAKGSFVREYTDRAKRAYPGRYDRKQKTAVRAGQE